MRLMVRNCSWQWMNVSLKCESSRIDGSLLHHWWFVCFQSHFLLVSYIVIPAAIFIARLVRKILLEKKMLFLATPLSWNI
jgi:hypothetical protein